MEPQSEGKRQHLRKVFKVKNQDKQTHHTVLQKLSPKTTHVPLRQAIQNRFFLTNSLISYWYYPPAI